MLSYKGRLSPGEESLPRFAVDIHSPSFAVQAALFAFFAMLGYETLEMCAANAPPPSPIQGAVEPSNGIWVTRVIEQVRLCKLSQERMTQIG